MAIKHELLAGLSRMRKTTIEVETIDTQSGVNADTVILILSEEVEATSENYISPTGVRIPVKSTEVRISEDEFEEFLKGYDDATGKYEGAMKFDVAKPQFDSAGKMTRSPNVWLTNVPFKGRGRNLQKQRADQYLAGITALTQALAGVTPEKKEKKVTATAELQENAVPTP
jgi:hypothetical protein